MVDKYGPVLSAEYLTGFNLLVVERYAASLFASDVCLSLCLYSMGTCNMMG